MVSVLSLYFVVVAGIIIVPFVSDRREEKRKSVDERIKEMRGRLEGKKIRNDA